MNAHRLRKWNPIKIFMYLLLAICSLLVFWCQGALTMHLTPLDFSSLNVEHRRRNYPPLTELSYSPSASRQNFFVSLLRNSTVNHDKLTSQQHYQQQHNEYPIKYLNEIEDFSRRKTWHMRMRKKHARLEAHRKRRLLFQRILDQRTNVGGNYENTIENLKISANPKLNINNLKHIINQNIITQHNHNNNKLYIKNTTSNGDYWKEEIFDALHKIMANISVASNRSRRDSRYHHQHNMHLPSSSNPPSFLLNNTNINQNYHRSNRNGHRQRRRKYCSARDPRTLAFEAPTVFEGKIKSMTPDRQANFSATVEILKVYKQQLNFALPRQVRLQFSYKNTSECDIYREEFRHRGFVREELEQGKIYFLFVKQISLGNFTMIGQPIKKISRTAKDVEIGVNEKYGKRASIESISPNLKVKEGKSVRIVCKVNGEPAPKVTWFKDGRSINRNKTKYHFVQWTRKRADLIIKSTVWSDSGKYECRAKNKLTYKRPVFSFTWLDVLSKHNPITERTNKPYSEGMKECPAGLASEAFCLNGGRCRFIESIQEASCDCPDGFSGKRCEDKTPNITANSELADPFVLNSPVAPLTDYEE